MRKSKYITKFHNIFKYWVVGNPEIILQFILLLTEYKIAPQ